ncbi:hypothetical protein SmJEL517_g05618 [Synchytrium microbalum]|uniref:UspA domain-containing protein n=1 Tax=Synchytrium microbalum TaxID=1806994 RepID=A0A507BVF7_9FUNG|nr:uncharacterized protein SmJEL517_g05618 [Synchytrium microbalum]TPX30929.1 hypothetical protein SmJEL517_g05618 [Synchytrium microbalum]
MESELAASISDLPDEIFEPPTNKEEEVVDHHFVAFAEPVQDPSQIFEDSNKSIPEHEVPPIPLSPASIPAAILKKAISSISLRSKPRRTVLVGVDSSKYSDAAFDFCVRQVAHDGDEIIVAHMVTTKPHGSYLLIDTGDVAEDHMKSALVDVAEAIRNHFAMRLATMIPHPRVTLRVEVRNGRSPKEDLCQLAADFGAECLVVGHAGSGTLKSLLMGSVSNYVVNHAPCPVFVARRAQ